MYDQNSARTAIRTYIQGSKVVRSFARTQNPASGCIHVHAEKLFRAMRTPRPIHVHVHVYGMQHARLRNGHYHLLPKYASTISGTRLRHYACYYGRRTWCLRVGLGCLSSKDSRLCWRGGSYAPSEAPLVTGLVCARCTAHQILAFHTSLHAPLCNHARQGRTLDYIPIEW